MSSAKTEVTEEHLIEIDEAFEVFAQKSGSIDDHELKVAIRALGFNIKREEAQRLAAAASRGRAERDGRIDLQAFRRIMVQKIEERDPDEEIASTFDFFDTEQSGRVGVEQLKQVAAELGEKIDDAELEAMVEEFAAGDTGEVTLREFRYIMKQTSNWD